MENNETQQLYKGAEIMVKTLECLGVTDIFAYPGGQAIEFHQAFQKSKIRVILPRHEQGGAFAADGMARATGKVAVCTATSGPGATNLLTGIADAYMDSVPTVFITGQVPATLIGRNAFQETDIIGMTRPIVKHSYLVFDVNDIAQTIVNAFHLAASGRPGPVVVDIPKNAQQAMAPFVFPAGPDLMNYNVPAKAEPEEIAKIKEMISKAERPCVYAGGGIIHAEASKELVEFVEKYNLPVTTTLLGAGSIPEDHPLSLRWLGMHGTYYANYAANESDLLICLGARFDDRVTGPAAGFAKGAKKIHVDIDLSEINKNVRVDLGIVADVKEVLKELNKEPVRKDYTAWHAQIAEWKKAHPLTYKRDGKLKPQFVIEKLRELTNGDAIIVPGVGQHQMWAAQFYPFKFPRQLLTSGGLGSMGFGLPAAMGAKVAFPEKTVVNIDGDGSFQMNIQELGTLSSENIGVKMIILNNQHLGMVAQWEDRFYGSIRGNTELMNNNSQRSYPDFVTIAKGYEIPGIEVTSEEELEPALKKMLETPGPFLLDCHIEYQDHVLPMMPPGKGYKDIITE